MVSRDNLQVHSVDEDISPVQQEQDDEKEKQLNRHMTPKSFTPTTTDFESNSTPYRQSTTDQLPRRISQQRKKIIMIESEDSL